VLKNKMLWLYYSDMLKSEYLQCAQEGKDVEKFEQQVQYIENMPRGKEKEDLARDLMLKMEVLPVAAGFHFKEPELYEEILEELPDGSKEVIAYDEQNIKAKISGAWYGRAIGCLLGIPVEGWTRGKIKGYAKESRNWPLSDYFSSAVSEQIKEKYDINDIDPTTPYDRTMKCWINNIKNFPTDDDTNYTLAALKILERNGRDFTSEDVAEAWVYSIPAFHTCTAERVAYRNLMNGILPPESGKYLNPYREWIGAQIRADFYGYINPGNPGAAVFMAYRDASVSHTKNGVYGSMLVAAILSLCACSKLSMPEIIKKALCQIPVQSRLYININRVCDQFAQKCSYSDVIDDVHSLYNEALFDDWCHTIPNAMIVTATLLYYENNFGAAIANAVLSGFDTDCNAATVGSILGMYNGFEGIEKHWLEKIAPVLSSSVHCFSRIELSETIQKTIDVIDG
jgi:ADP-ribosylglycohydrolase